jgi:deoxyribodipyrimidine photo-lyase
LIRQLYWRDFYANILYEFPRVLGHSLKPKYDKISWHYSDNLFKKWCNGETGYPIVDAGMKQMNATGYMHNRARLIVASFLVKTLLIDWRKGEQYFSKKLTDYDPANNNGNWQWISGGGADSQPYFRVFNPWRQAEEYDPNCEYIKKWLPELKDVPVKDLLNWDTKYINYKDVKYPKPIVNYEEQRDKVIKMYSKIF